MAGAPHKWSRVGVEKIKCYIFQESIKCVYFDSFAASDFFFFDLLTKRNRKKILYDKGLVWSWTQSAF